MQEALTNIVKHAEAKTVSIILVRRGSLVSVLIEDDGSGFVPDEAREDGLGLVGMRERVALIGGKVDDRVVARRGDHARGGGSRSMSVRIVVVDDHAVVRTGLRLMLDAETDFEVVGEAGDAHAAVFEVRAQKPDVILLDVVMPGESGIEALPKLKHEAPDARVLVLSMQDDPRYVREAFAAGADGYVLKEAADAEVVAAVREIAAGGRYVHPALGARMVAADAEAQAKQSANPLSAREEEVLRLLALGHTNQEIAGLLFISVRTAETHRAHIMQKLGFASRAELVRHALAQGLLDE